MKEIKSEDLDRAVFDLFDQYVHSQINRREFLDRVSKYAVGGFTAAAIFNYLSPNYAEAAQVEPSDERLRSVYVTYDSPKGAGTMRGYFVRPVAKAGRLPGVVVVHENRGLNPHIEDVARRVGLAGFVALAPDVLTPLGGYPGTDDEGRTLQRKRDRNEMLEDFIAGYGWLAANSNCNGKVGVVGFCFGGRIANMMAVRIPDLSAAVPFYGGQPTEEEVLKIKAPLLLHYAELDPCVNAGWPAYEAALKKHGKIFSAHHYPGVRNGFHNDSTPRFDKEAAELAWSRTIDFFKENLTHCAE